MLHSKFFTTPKCALKPPTLLEAITPCSLQDFLGRVSLAHPCGFQMKTLSCWFSSVWRETVGFLVCCASHWWGHQAASGPSQSVFTLGLWLHTLAALDPKWVFYGREGRADGVALWRSLPFGGLSSRAVQVASEEEGQWLFLASLILFWLYLNPSNMGPLSF